ncbi:MAG TPA: YbaY family lipoprotein [Anaerolineales bacterium]|nr:YbaY family lipoprotein [Anaerolineales bacterium]
MSDNYEGPGNPDQQNHGKFNSRQVYLWMIVVVIAVLIGILSFATLTASGVLTKPEPTKPIVFITITEPGQGSKLDLTWAVNIQGQAGGLFEGNLVVQALDAGGKVIAQKATTISAPNAGTGGSGPWSVDLNIDAPNGSQGQIVAFSPSPVDGSWIAEDSIAVGFGESPVKRELVNVENHLWRLTTLNERPPIKNTLITLQFENFQAAGFGGCNNYKTSFERSGPQLNFGFVTSTAKECELPVGIMAQEAAYFSALEQIVANRIEAQQLSLVDSSGASRLVYDAVVMGNIFAEDDIELPEDAVVYISLSDASLAGAETALIAEQVVSGVTQFPIPFSVNYNPKQIIENHTYALGVRIEDSSGNLLYINPTTYHVITAGNPSQIDATVASVQ